MDSISREELKILIDHETDRCISIFLPTYRAGTEMQQNQIRFRNLLRTTEDKLQAGNLRPQEVKTLLEPAQALASNIPFWRRQGDGLAVFLSSGLFRSYCLPLLFEELILIGNRFHIKPLLPLLQGEELFYVLALSQNSVRLFEGTKFSVKEIELTGLPRNVSAAAANDEPEKQVRFHTGAAGGGERGALISGHGSEVEDGKENIMKFFRQIDKGLHNFRKGERAPLILACVDYLYPLYKEINTCPALLEKRISGNPEAMSPDNLHRQAWQIVAPLFEKTVDDALSLYRQSSGTGLTSRDVKEIVTAARHGRVGLLFVAREHRPGGTMSGPGGEAPPQNVAADSEDLPDAAAVHTFLNGGSVLALPRERMPETGALAAVFRY